MQNMETIKAFLRSLTAISQTCYELWSPKGELIFSTHNQKIDFLTTSSHLEFAKKIVLSDTFTYTPIDHQNFLCGIPMDMGKDRKGAILATGKRLAFNNGDRHPGQLFSFLQQVLNLVQMEKNNSCTHTVAENGHPNHHFENLFLFANISKQFRSTRIKQPILGKLMCRIFDNMDADAVFLELPQKPNYNLLEIRQELLERHDNPSALKTQLKQLIAAGVKQCKGNYVIIKNCREDPALETLSERHCRFIAVAVRHIKDSLGWLGLISRSTDSEFKMEELNILQTLANQLAGMMANMTQTDNLERFTVNIVCSLVNAIETKDAFTHGHSKRVHHHAMLVAKHMGLSHNEVSALKWAAALHDIGKIGIPERILRKPGKLTQKEYGLIKQHPMKGKTILAPIRQLAPSMGAIAYHHERYDGSGYPEGLEGERIPLPARIIAVADTYDALTSRRSYHASETPSKALKILDRVAGTQLDPNLVKIFKDVFQQPQTVVEPLG